MRILIANDDGYTSQGIKKLAKALAKKHEVVVFAPIKCNSGMAHAMTFGKPIYLKEIDIPAEDNYKCYSVTGTPADCVKLGTEIMANNPPEIIISGINTEPNIGTTVVYSGTASAAMEGTVLGYNSIAVSANPESDDDFDYITQFFVDNFDYYCSLCSKNYSINININNERIGNKGHKLAHLGIREYSDRYLVGEETEEGIPHILVGEPLIQENHPHSDVVYYESGYATITPLTSDHTMFSAFDILKEKMDK